MTDPLPPAPSTSSVSAAERAMLLERHQQQPSLPGMCFQCSWHHPCPTRRAVLALDAAERALDASRAETAALRAERDAVRVCLAGALAPIVCAGPESGTAERELTVVIVVPDTWREQALAAMGSAPTPGADGGTT
jgi:hypothetical protein